MSFRDGIFTGQMELKSKSSQNRVPKQSLREDMSTERQAKNKKKQKARKETVELFNLEFKTQGGGDGRGLGFCFAYFLI